MAKTAQDFGIEFVNIELAYSLDLLADDGEIPGVDGLLQWVEKSTKAFCKVSMGYNEKSHSFTVSFTDKGSRPVGENAPCLTQHGKTLLSALAKVYFLIEVLGDGTLKSSAMIENLLEEREDYIAQQLVGLLKKRS
jgi:hypothetical protein